MLNFVTCGKEGYTVTLEDDTTVFISKDNILGLNILYRLLRKKESQEIDELQQNKEQVSIETRKALTKQVIITGVLGASMAIMPMSTTTFPIYGAMALLAGYSINRAEKDAIYISDSYTKEARQVQEQLRMIGDHLIGAGQLPTLNLVLTDPDTLKLADLLFQDTEKDRTKDLDINRTNKMQIKTLPSTFVGRKVSSKQ